MRKMNSCSSIRTVVDTEITVTGDRSFRAVMRLSKSMSESLLNTDHTWYNQLSLYIFKFRRDCYEQIRIS